MLICTQATPENRDDQVDGLLAKVGSKQSLLRRGSNGKKGEGPQVARIPKRHSEANDGIIAAVTLDPQIRPRMERGCTG